MPRISVIVTVYKRTKYLAEALNSALTQSYPDFEIIVADDSGTEAGREIVAACGNFDRVKYSPNPTTLGIAVSVARAVEQAQGEFIAILNDDDVWERDLLAELIAPLLVNPNRIAAFADHWVMDEAGRTDATLTQVWSANANRSVLPPGNVRDVAKFTVVEAGIPIATSALFRKDAVDWSLVVPEVSGAYDYWISCLLGVSGRPIYYVPQRLARYRVHPEMETQRRGADKGEDLIYILTTLRQRRWFAELDSEIKSRLAEVLLRVARNKLNFGSSRQSRRFFWRSFLLSFRPVALAGALGSFIPTRLRKELWRFLGPLMDRHSKPNKAGIPG